MSRDDGEIVRENETGSVKFTNEEKHFGFVTIGESRDDAFFHFSDFKHRVDGGIEKGAQLTYDLEEGIHNGEKKYRARNIDFA